MAASSRPCCGRSWGPKRWLAWWRRRSHLVGAELSLEPAQVNGYPALIMRLNGELDSVLAVRIDDGLVTGLYTVRNPEKLSHMERETALSR